MKEYFKQTSSPVFGLIMALPLMIYYEASMLLNQQGGAYQVRNAADVLFKRLFSALGFEGIWGGLVMFMVLFLVSALLQGLHKSENQFKISWGYTPVFIAESGFYAMLIFVLISRVMQWLAPAMALSGVDIAYCLGAGVYEELLFRAVILQIFLKLAGFIPGNERINAIIMILISALIFSGAHYLGEFGDSFTIQTFLARTAGGVMLGFVYMYRGLGAAVYTHAIYDVFTYIL